MLRGCSSPRPSRGNQTQGSALRFRLVEVDTQQTKPSFVCCLNPSKAKGAQSHGLLCLHHARSISKRSDGGLTLQVCLPNPATHVPMGLAQLPRVISHQVDPPLVMHARVPAPLTRFASTCPQVSIVVRRAQDDVEGSSFIYECKVLRCWGGLVAALLWSCFRRDAVMALGMRERQ